MPAGATGQRPAAQPAALATATQPDTAAWGTASGTAGSTGGPLPPGGGGKTPGSPAGTAAGGTSPGQEPGTGPGGLPEPGAPARLGFRYALKNWRVRSRLLLLVVLPTLAAVILGGVSVVSSVGSALAFQRVERFSKLGGQITGLVQALQTEREDTIRFITMGKAGGGRGSAPAAAALERSVLAQDYRASNAKASGVRSTAGTIGSGYPALAQQEAQGAIAAINGLPSLRQAATGTQVPALVVIQKYAGTIDQLLALDSEIAAGSNDAALADTVRAVGLISGMKEQVSREQAILSSALTSDQVGATGFQRSQISALNAAQAEQQADSDEFSLTVSGPQRQLYDNALSSALADRAASQVQQAISLAFDGGSASTNPAFTNAANGSAYLVTSLRGVEQGFMFSIISQSGSLRDRAITSATVDGLAVILVLGLALFFTVAVGRSMTRPLRRLRTGALEVAGVRLPETVRQMSSGDANGSPMNVQPIDVDSTDEIGEVARAFDQVHREAVRLASNEAALRGNVNAMFVNLSRRSQSLVERQIRLIDDLEQGEQDPERLGNLFQMDHLATRMRRNSENLLVLAGHDLSRRWSQPVGLVDVLRAAVSEIEQYGRVTLNVQPGISVRGHAVNDVVHLLAELVENATTFSPGQTPVNVAGHLLNSGGALLDITDHGVGMESEEMAHANWRLDNPPVVDVAVSRRMGLFVVARLAARHGIRVRLRPASQGGLTALVWLPDEVISRESIGSGLNFRRFQTPPPGDTPAVPAVGGDDRTAAALAVSAARTARFTPLRPEADDTPSENGDRLDTATVLAAPAAEVTLVDARPAGPTADEGPAAGAGTADGPIVPPPANTSDDNRLPIFESVESDWFRRGRHGAERPAASPSAASPAGAAAAAGSASWSSPADDGWRAAEVAQAPVSGGRTGAGLPKRVPKANLVPGGVGAAAIPAPAAPTRSATQARDRLASFQRGIKEARAAASPADGAPPGTDGTGQS